MSTFETSVQPDEVGSPVLRVAGDLDLATAPTLLMRAEELLGADRREGLRVDLSAVTFIDSSGLGALIKIRNLLLESGGELMVTARSSAVDRVLALVGLTDLFAPGDQKPSDRPGAPLG